jgi:hypothetical protein
MSKVDLKKLKNRENLILQNMFALPLYCYKNY